MAFYLHPPSGTISLAALEECSLKRLQFLSQLADFEGDYVATKDYIDNPATVEDVGSFLIEGSKNDRVGHYFLRMISSQDPTMTSFFVTMETALFRFRFSCMSQEEIMTMFQSLKKDTRRLFRAQQKQYCKLTNDINILKKSLKLDSNWRQIVDHYLCGKTDTCIKLPFTYVPNLVAHRLVLMDKGLAIVSCDKLGMVLVEMYRRLLESCVEIARTVAKQRFDDVRYRRIANRCLKLFRHGQPRGLSRDPGSSLVSRDQVDVLSAMFPACMARLHRRLRRYHRLPHHSRIQYTLFLKELGLSVHEAVMFWRAEYSQPPLEGCTDGHAWATDERRYTYSIRHLYGLEGARINYRGHGCPRLQEAGACPYVVSAADRNLSDSPSRPCHACTKALFNDIENLITKQFPDSQILHEEENLPNLIVSKGYPINESPDQNKDKNIDTTLTKIEVVEIPKVIRNPCDYFFTYQKLLKKLRTGES